MTRCSRHPALLLALTATLGIAACGPASSDFAPNPDKADGLSCSAVQECGTRDIEVIFTNPFCDECTSEEKAVLLERSEIIARVVQLLDDAMVTVDIAQYTFSRRSIEEAIIRAKDRGVTVRLAMDSGQDRSGSLSRRLQDAGVDVRFITGKAVTPDRSGILHTKYVIVDETTLLTGSNNWSSTGTSINNENTMVIRAQPGDEILEGFACHFEAIWGAKPDEANACSGENVFFTPGSAARLMIRDSIRAAETSIDVLMHHLTFDDLAKELAKAQESGVSVRVIVNEADQDEVSGKSFKRLLDAGGQIHFKRVNEDAFQFMHNKLAIIDGKLLINGSGNWSGSAFFSNYENFVRYYEPQVVRQFEDLFDRLWSWSISAEGLSQDLTAAEQQAQENQIFLGSLHAHFHANEGANSLDDGRPQQLDADEVEVEVDVGDTVSLAAQHAYNYAQNIGGLDFLALSPHTTDVSLSDDPNMANMSEEAFAVMAEAAERVNESASGTFVALASMEWSTNSTGNHLGIFGSSKLAKVVRGQFDKLYDEFLPSLTADGDRPLLMMNHPRTMRENEEFLTGGWDQVFGTNLLDIPNDSQRKKKFNDYGLDDYSPLREILPSWIDGSAMPDRGVVDDTLENIRLASAPYMRLMEVTIARGTEFGDESSRNPSLIEDEFGEISRRVKVHTDYDYYLERGYRIAPVANHDNHFANWGAGHSSRTGVVSDSLTKKKLLDALDRRRVFASEDENLNLNFFINGRIPMGSETATLENKVRVSALISDADYSGPYLVRVFRGTPGSAMREVASSTQGEDGWLHLDVDIAPGATNIIYLEVVEVDANRMAWTAPIWVEAI